MTKNRRAFILDPLDCKWREVEFADIERGHVFRLFEADNSPVYLSNEGTFIGVALSDAFQNDQELWAIQTCDIITWGEGLPQAGKDEEHEPE